MAFVLVLILNLVMIVNIGRRVVPAAAAEDVAAATEAVVVW